MRKIEPVFPMLHEAITLGLILDLSDHQDLLDARHSAIAYAPPCVAIPAPLDWGQDKGLPEEARWDIRFFVTFINIVPVGQI